MESPHLPHENCYWVEPGRLMAGQYPGAVSPTAALRRLQNHLDSGVRCFIDLTEPHELPAYDGDLAKEARARGIDVVYHRSPIRDTGIPKSKQQMAEILDAIQVAIARRQTVYVHCNGGVGRTGTVVGCHGCHLVRSSETAQEAVDRLSRLWSRVKQARRFPHSPENDRQRISILEWSDPDRIGLRDRYRGCLLGLAAGDAKIAANTPWIVRPNDRRL